MTPLLLCCDYDGTLAPIASHPARARLPAATRRLLTRLVRAPGVRLALVSGRSLDNLKQAAAIPGAYYVGNHGLELEGPQLRYVNPDARAARPLLKQVAGRLKAALRAVPGAWVEEKGLTCSVHWRNVSRSAHRAFHRVVAQCLRPYLAQRTIQRTIGKRVIEIRPAVAWDKGASLAWLVSQLRARNGRARPFVLYFGDDQTDEAAFRVTNRLRGLSLFVGNSRRATAAAYRLRGPADVRRWLAALWQLHREAQASGRKGTWTGIN